MSIQLTDVPNSPAGGNIIINPGHRTQKIMFSVPVNKNIYTVIISDVTYIKHIETWFCNNRPYVIIWWETVYGITKEEVIEDPLIIKFDSGGDVKPHDVYISVNGHEVGTLINTVPDGYYKFEVDPSFLNYPERGVARNSIEINTVHQNGGHYVVGSDMEVRLHLKNYVTRVVASSQEEANQIAEDNLPPGFYKAPDSISIESSGTEVLLSTPVTLEATSSPNLMVWATFDNGDGAVYIHEAESGVYRGTWTPQHPGDKSTGDCVITIHAKAAGVKGEMTRTVTIINPTKLKVEILEPLEGFDVSAGDAVVVSVRVTRTDDQGRDCGYGSPGNPRLMICPYFSNGDGWITLSARDGGVYTGIWVPKNEGDCTIEVYADDYAGKFECSSASVSGTVSAGDFSISGPGSLSMMVHDYVETQIEVISKKSFSKPVTLSYSWISPAPTGVTISFDPNPVTPPAGGSISSTLNITTTCDAIPGTYQLNVIGTSGSLTNSTQIILTINPRPLVLKLDTDLDLYHPGNRVTVRGLVTDDIDRTVPNVNITQKIIDINGNVVEVQVETTDGIGKYETVFTLPDDAPTGTWTVSTTASRRPGYIDKQQVRYFEVEEADFDLWGDDLTMSVGTVGESIITIAAITSVNNGIDLAIENRGALPIFATIALNPPSVTPPRGGRSDSALTVNVPLTANRGTYKVNITGVMHDDLRQPPLTRRTTITLTIVPGISGDVLEVGLFDPIQGAVVTAQGIEETGSIFSTNAPNSGINPDDGTYWLMVPPGVYKVWATAPGYITSTGFDGDRVIVEAGKETEGIDFRLLPTFTKIYGAVTDANTGLPISDAVIDVLGPPYPYEPYDNVTIITTTDAHGNYSTILEYTVQPSGIYDVTASTGGYLSQSIIVYVNWDEIIADYTWIPANFLLVPVQPIPDVTCSDPDVIIDYARTTVTDDPVGAGFDVANAPANVDLATAKGFTIAAAGPDGAYLFDITFPTPVNTGFVLYKLPAWTEIPYVLTGANTVQVQLAINGGILDPAFILASGAAEAYLRIEDDTCLGYEVYVDGVYQFTEGEDGTPDGDCAFHLAPGTHTIELRKNGYSTSDTINFLCGYTYHWDDMPDYWCGESCEVYLTIEDDTCLGYEVYVDGAYQFTEGEDGTPDGDCAFHLAPGTHTIELRKNGCTTSVTVNFLCGYTHRWNSMPDYWCGSSGGGSSEAYLEIIDYTCAGYQMYVDGVYQFTEGEDGTPDGYCAFYVSEGTHTIELRKNSYSTSATINFLGGYTYKWDGMPDYWCWGG